MYIFSEMKKGGGAIATEKTIHTDCRPGCTKLFIHGLESSSQGSKGRWFAEHFPDVLVPDFPGSLQERMTRLNSILQGREDIILVGSSFGGLMATIHALENQDRVKRVILFAPALNFPEFERYMDRETSVPALLYIGSHDEVCPPAVVIPAAQQVYSDLTIHLSDDDHLLKKTFRFLDWHKLLAL